MSPTADVRAQILEANRQAAAALRQRFAETHTLVVNLISSPGAGKTTLLEATLERLAGRFRTGVLVGDIATERDAERIRRLGLPAYQILTGGACHLDARQIEEAWAKAGFGALDILFIENVGNLICPTSYDLGEDFKVVLLSLTEGDDKPFKYPAIFSRAELALLTKMDLLPLVTFDVAAVEQQIRTLNPTGTIIPVSAKTGQGMELWCRTLEQRWQAKRG
ncbi:MAG: hydrogenase nickel incorporation protein HypB [Thermoanaerobaculum sp.]|nr:hydrogenase nickel incorporation protein HypB [Thermoanaerobaculum sp.]MDW7967198.1 hydrogenase nickel incorporation protein HypB [Thermoanaerobaculum sp.]